VQSRGGRLNRLAQTRYSYAIAVGDMIGDLFGLHDAFQGNGAIVRMVWDTIHQPGAWLLASRSGRPPLSGRDSARQVPEDQGSMRRLNPAWSK
jgi:hypothetical protein